MRQVFGKHTEMVATALVALLFLAPAGYYAALAVTGTTPDLQARHRSASILAVNDIYRLKGVGESEAGGMHRLATLRLRLERDAPDLLLLHAGDFLAPSLLSRLFKGEQMVDLMNRLDHRPREEDRRLFVTFGNHEFDHTRCDKDDKPLLARLGQSEFTWLTANLDFSACEGLTQVPALPQVKEGTLVESGDVKIGIFGISLTPDPGDKKRYPAVRPLLDQAVRMITSLKQQGAEIVVALTHLPASEDLKLLENTAALGLDLVVGGHDHDHMALPREAPRIFKADSDARTAWHIVVGIAPDGTRSVEGHLIALNDAVTPDPEMVAAADGWLLRHDSAFCGGLEPARPAGCLADVFGRTATLLEAEETANRGRETGFGDWLADRAREATGAEVALINSGGLRLNYNLEPGDEITRRQIEELIEYDDLLVAVEVPRETLRAAVDHGLRSAGSGAWPHLSGLRATRPRGEAPAAVALPGDATGAAGPVSVTSLPFVLCGGDGYDFGQARPGEDMGGCIDRLRAGNARRLAFGEPCLEAAKGAVSGLPPDSLTLKALLVGALCEAGETGIAPAKDGRIGG